MSRALLTVCLAGAFAAAQCIVDSPGGSKVNINRPLDSDTPVVRHSPISHLNKRLPKWLCFTAGYRTRLESSADAALSRSDAYLLTRFRLGAAIKPASWFRTYLELQDADAFWKTPPLVPPYQSTWDLRRAYLDFGDIEEGALALRIGRQDLNFGHQRLVGTSYWRNASSGWDAAMAVFNSRWLKLNVWAASPVVAYANGLSHRQPGNDLHGIYGALKRLVPGSSVEPFLLWRLSPGFKTELGGTAAKLDEKTVGVHWAGAASGFDYDAEVAGQTGSIGSDRIRAWAWSAISGYTFQSARLRPRVFVKYDFASGDRNPKDGRHGTFDQLYPSIHDHHGLADRVAWQNLKSIRCGLSPAPTTNGGWPARMTPSIAHRERQWRAIARGTPGRT
jgi:hypothetical protein